MNLNQLKTALPGCKGKKLKNSPALITKWGERILQSIQSTKKYSAENNSPAVLTEYPRPQMARRQNAGKYRILNGWWKYAIMDSLYVPEKWDGKILVPFSPETELSCVKRQLRPGEYLWYEKEIELEEETKEKIKTRYGSDEVESEIKESPEVISRIKSINSSVDNAHKRIEDQRVLLHFGAVDQSCKIYLNGKQIAEHSGGYLPFSVEITNRLHTGKNILHVCVQDLSDTSYLTRGKQKLDRGGMFYTAQSGIWQTVWMEWVPREYIERVRIVPLYDDDMLDIKIRVNHCTGRDYSATVREEIRLKLFEAKNFANQENADISCWQTEREVIRELTVEAEPIQMKDEWAEYHVKLHVPDKKSWTPETPWLYGLHISTSTDSVASYTAMRCFTVEKQDKKISRICLNHSPYFMDGVLDQGYWPESLMTPPSEEAIIFDISRMKQQGFNMLRKHCKIEPQRWYYHCDRIGMIVWQDMVNGGVSYNMMNLCYLPNAFPAIFQKLSDKGQMAYKRTGRIGRECRKVWRQETEQTIYALQNHPSIAVWVLFNEGWGQFDSADAYRIVKKLDPGRIIDHASGWYDQNQGDIRSVHNYFRKLKVEKGPRPFALSEYGGYTYGMKEHLWSDGQYGYGTYKNQKKLQEAYEKLRKEISELVNQGLSAAVYTQVSDIEDEINGILTYDRKEWKVKPPARL